MAGTFLYPSAKKAFLDGDLDLLVADIRVIIIDQADYNPGPTTTNDFLDDVPAGARVATSTALQNKTTTGGVFDADDIVIAAVTGDPSETVVIYAHTGVESTSRLIAHIDGLTLTPNGEAVTVVWDGDPNRIFRI